MTPEGVVDTSHFVAPPNYVSDDPDVWNLPAWTPSQVVGAARKNGDLAFALRFLDDALTMPLGDFADLQADAAGNPGWDFSNDGCSDRNVVTGGRLAVSATTSFIAIRSGSTSSADSMVD